MMNALLKYLSLFTSVGTLLCCALPSLLVLVGLGASVAGFLSIFPWLVVLSRHKNWVFVISGALIAANFYYTGRRAACPVDSAEACQEAATVSRAVLWISAALYAIGVFSAYVLGPLLMAFDS
jgi:hypothetical protein